MVTRVALVALAASVAACNWTTFDDLAEETWVDRVVKPNDSRQYGQVVTAMPNPGTATAVACTLPDGAECGTDQWCGPDAFCMNPGANMVVLGRANSSLSTLRYDPTGKRTVTTIDAFEPLGFTLFPEKPPVIAVPGENRFSFPVITGTDETGQGRVFVMNGDTLGGSPVTITFTGGDVNDQRTRIEAIAFGEAHLTRPPQAAPPTDPAKVLVLGRGHQINTIVDYDTPLAGAGEIWGCNHGGTSTAVFGAIVADIMDDAASTADDDPEVIVGIGPRDRDMPMSELRIYAPDQLRGESGSGTNDAPSPCPDPLEPATMIAGTDAGAAMLATKFDPASTLSDLVYATPSINLVRVRLGDLGVTREISITNIGSQFGYALAAGNLDDDPEPELVVGAPASNVDGAANAGAVYIYDYDTATDEFTQITMFTTSSPTAAERYGKSVAVAPWSPDRNVLVVGAEGKVLTYFRTSFYDDVRQGR